MVERLNLFEGWLECPLQAVSRSGACASRLRAQRMHEARSRPRARRSWRRGALLRRSTQNNNEPDACLTSAQLYRHPMKLDGDVIFMVSRQGTEHAAGQRSVSSLIPCPLDACSTRPHQAGNQPP